MARFRWLTHPEGHEVATQYPSRDKYASNVQGTCMLAWDRWVYWHVKQQAVLATVAEGAVACRAREAQLDNLAGKCGAYLDLVQHLVGVMWTRAAVEAVKRGDDVRVAREALERHLYLRVGLHEAMEQERREADAYYRKATGVDPVAHRKEREL